MHALHQREHVYKFNQSFEKIHFFLGIDENSPCESYHRAVKKNRKMEKKKRLHRPSRIIISIVWKIFERFSTKSRLKFFPIPPKKEKKKIKNSHRTRHLPITDFGDRFTHEIAPIERDPVQNHCAQFTAANSAPERSSLETTTRRSTDRLISRFARLYSPGKSTLLV